MLSFFERKKPAPFPVTRWRQAEDRIQRKSSLTRLISTPEPLAYVVSARFSFSAYTFLFVALEVHSVSRTNEISTHKHCSGVLYIVHRSPARPPARAPTPPPPIYRPKSLLWYRSPAAYEGHGFRRRRLKRTQSRDVSICEERHGHRTIETTTDKGACLAPIRPSPMATFQAFH